MSSPLPPGAAVKTAPATMAHRLAGQLRAVRADAIPWDEPFAGLPSIELEFGEIYRPDTARIAFHQAQRLGLMAVLQDDASLLVVREGADLASYRWLLTHLGAQALLQAHRAITENFDRLLAQWERNYPTLARDANGVGPNLPRTGEQGIVPEREELSLGAIETTDNDTVRLVNATLLDALNAGASDVHIESTPQGLAIKFRLDGVLAPIAQRDGVQTAERVISRIKVMAELDIAERRIPQDGRLKLAAGGRDIDVRVSIMPSIHGEDAVLRILDRQALVSQMQSLSLQGLGFDPAFADQLLPMFKLPYGMVLITGPTGSGKTTTLYAAISQTRDPREKVVTIEDPVEYQLDGILQIPVNERKGLSFAGGLRSILRHDPDKILVGEIRDSDTARIAVQAALTGHLVMTTVHANNALDVLSRFRQFGIDPYDVITALVAVVAQRLVRRLCTHCAVPDTPVQQQRLQDALDQTTTPTSRPSGSSRLMRPVGCSHCRHTGYRGRQAIGELLVFDRALRRDLLAHGSMGLSDETLAARMTPLHQQALLAAWAGHTSLEEALRVSMVQ